MKGQCNAEAGETETRKGGRKQRNRPAFKKILEHPHVRGVPVCINPSPSRSLVNTGVIVGIYSVYVHPREFLFVSSYRLIRRPVPVLVDDTVKPFAGDLQERRVRWSAGCGTTGTSASNKGDLLRLLVLVELL